jgi:hypothetical protein
MFLTPTQEPFFGGTYFPKSSRYGLASFAELLPRVAAAYHEQGAAIAEQNARLKAALALTNPEPPDAGSPLPAEAPRLAFASLARAFDPVNGGFGGAPKFPHETDLELCLRRYAREDDRSALAIVTTTLSRMAEGGIHDQLGGGFCRYSVDAEWTIPHFEKMLYDNAALLVLYADAWRATGEKTFARAARGIATWTSREMRAPEGGFYSSLDADSEHEEGKFYVWTPAEARAALDAGEWAVASRHWGLDGPPNFEGAAWHLRVTSSLADIARELGIDISVAEARLDSARAKLLAVRARRVRPGRDEKILTAWNALTIGALARAARVFEEAEWLAGARTATDFVHETMWRGGRLLATYKDGRAHLDAYLDDHAYLLAGLLELVQTEFRRRDLDWAIELANALLNRFEDRAHGGFFFTAHDHEPLIHRPKPGHDNATPSGNGIAAQALTTLGHWLGEARYLDAAERTIRAFARELGDRPAGCATLLIALEDCLVSPTSVLLRGDPATCAAWRRILERRFRPAQHVLDLSGQKTPLPGALAEPRDAGGPGAAAWVCRGAVCEPPIRSADQLEAALASRA